MNPKLYEKIVSKIHDTMKQKEKRNHERHSSSNKFSNNGEYQILYISDIYKLILKSLMVRKTMLIDYMMKNIVKENDIIK